MKLLIIFIIALLVSSCGTTKDPCEQKTQMEIWRLQHSADWILIH